MNYASPWKRLGAFLVDVIVSIPLGAAIGILFVELVGKSTNPQYLHSQLNAVGAIASWLYFSLMESSKFQGTLGKMALDLKVCDLDGNPIGFLRSSGRHWGKLISAVLLFTGYLMIFFTRRKQGLHDLMAGCVVLDTRSLAPVPQNENAISNPTASANQRREIAQNTVTTINPKPFLIDGDSSESTKEKVTANSTSKPLTGMGSSDEELWAFALGEFESEDRRAGLWAKCFSLAGGIESSAKAAYLSQRVLELQHEQEAEKFKYEEHRQIQRVRESSQREKTFEQWCRDLREP